jgi:ABC-2 type transport system permease protein
MELLLTLRRGESLLVIAGIPVGILVFFTSVDVLPHGRGRAVDFLVPGVLALAVISNAMTSLSIATGFERQSGVLKRLGTTPLGREGLLVAKVLSTVAIVALQVVAVIGVGLGLGWRLPSQLGLAAAVLALGVVAFAGLGFLLAGRLRAELNLAVANALFILFLLLGGIVVPLREMPDGVRALAGLLPAEPLATALRAALTGAAVRLADVATLAVWALVAGGIALLSFRWD